MITGHTLKLVVIEPATSPLDVEALRTAVSERLSSQPRATQRIDTSGPEPRWVDATAFEISDHVRRREEPGCASRDDLWRAVSKLMSEHLDHERPLWTFDLIGPLGDGREAIAVRIHHAMADGISAVRFLDDVLWDQHLEPPRENRDRAFAPLRRSVRGSTRCCGCPRLCVVSSAIAGRTRPSTARSVPPASSPSPSPRSRS
ncbi:hypothetical protein ONE62_21340 [Rhodococcus opacus]|nr:hypothetical protein ONE62_21340 [Rhodococcus opacus]